MSGNEIGVQVSLEDVANRDLILLRSLQIDLHIALRVDHNRLALRRQHVRCVRQTT